MWKLLLGALGFAAGLMAGSNLPRLIPSDLANRVPQWLPAVSHASTPLAPVAGVSLALLGLVGGSGLDAARRRARSMPPEPSSVERASTGGDGKLEPPGISTPVRLAWLEEQFNRQAEITNALQSEAGNWETERCQWITTRDRLEEVVRAQIEQVEAWDNERAKLQSELREALATSATDVEGATSTVEDHDSSGGDPYRSQLRTLVRELAQVMETSRTVTASRGASDDVTEPEANPAGRAARSRPRRGRPQTGRLGRLQTEGPRMGLVGRRCTEETTPGSSALAAEPEIDLLDRLLALNRSHGSRRSRRLVLLALSVGLPLTGAVLVWSLLASAFARRIGWPL
jgi:hypothetical protein